MLFYIALTTITVLFAGLVCSKRMPSRFLTGGEQMALPQQASRLTRQQTINGLALTLIFLLLFGVSAFRTCIGNDYERYVEFVHLIEYNQVVPTEIGFNGLVRLINTLSGFENAKLMFAIYAFVTVLLFLVGISSPMVTGTANTFIPFLMQSRMKRLSSPLLYLAPPPNHR
jgi:hypothetical protein